MEEFVVEKVLPNLKSDAAHSIDHFRAVRDHAVNAIKELDIDDYIKSAIVTAAFLHDLNDKKLQKEIREERWDVYVLRELNIPNADLIIKMIDIVSCSKWGDRRMSDNDEEWLYIPRYCDRLEATGMVGVQRCLDYNLHKCSPVSTPTTPKVSSRDSIYQVATKERYEQYSRGSPSMSVMDHMYDKILHIDLPEWVHNSYLKSLFSQRRREVEDWVLNNQ